MPSVNPDNMVIHSVFYQAAEPDVGLPAVWCVQYTADNKEGVDYLYFKTKKEADDCAAIYGYPL